jgi:hypothetical protein
VVLELIGVIDCTGDWRTSDWAVFGCVARAGAAHMLILQNAAAARIEI